MSVDPIPSIKQTLDTSGIEPATGQKSPAIGQTSLDGRGAPTRLDTIKQLAQNFESMLLSQMLKGMNDDDNKQDSTGFGMPLTEQLYGEVANAMTASGGFGLATSLQDALARTTPGGTADDSAALAAGASFPRPFAPWLPESSSGVLPIGLPNATSGTPLTVDRVSSAYGTRRDPITGDQRQHKGIDIPLATGDDVLSVKAGKVVESGVENGYGNTVVVDHGNGVTTRYAHLSAIDVGVGESVGAGQRLGLAGQTGRATGPHLHLEVRKDGVALDPLGADATRLLGRGIMSTETFAAAADYQHGASR